MLTEVSCCLDSQDGYVSALVEQYEEARGKLFLPSHWDLRFRDPHGWLAVSSRDLPLGFPRAWIGGVPCHAQLFVLRLLGTGLTSHTFVSNSSPTEPSPRPLLLGFLVHIAQKVTAICTPQ